LNPLVHLAQLQKDDFYVLSHGVAEKRIGFVVEPLA
jgi:hypothetical protein